MPTAGRPSQPGTGSSPRRLPVLLRGLSRLHGPREAFPIFSLVGNPAGRRSTASPRTDGTNSRRRRTFPRRKITDRCCSISSRQIRLGLAEAEEIGAVLFKDSEALGIWKRALLEGPPAALDVSLAMLRIQDEIEPGAAVVWGPASAIAAFPRPFCRLVGLTSRSWPRRAGEDPLLPTHVMPQERLDPLPIHESDRRDFGTICRMADHEVVCSRARQDSEGRLNGVSPLYPQDREKEPLAQSRAPEHAASQGDRLAARPREFTSACHWPGPPPGPGLTGEARS